jgi:DNA polymerase III delta prime subunit
MNSIPWIEKYRPTNINSILYNYDIINMINTFIKNKNIPNLILYGSPGCGKTSISNIIINELYDKSKDMVLELNSSDDRGINVIRKIKTFAEQKSILSFINNITNNHKLVILDEADSMTFEAQFALRRIIELYSDNIRFCIICNNIYKIHNAI